MVKNIFLALGLALPLVGCVTTTSPVATTKSYSVDSDTYQSTGKSQRIKTIVLHYTVSDNERSIKTLTTGQVSAHYLILDRHDDKIYSLVDENERAWHAGDSGFAGRTILNDTSIGIEIVNAGIKPEYRNALNNDALDYHPYEHYVAFDELQIKKAAELVQDIAKRYDIPPKNIVGHADIAPSRKIDPGEHFPWQGLAAAGLGFWPQDLIEDKRVLFEAGSRDRGVAIVQRGLAHIGYSARVSGVLDEDTQLIIAALQRRYRPAQIDGLVDIQTMEIIKALTEAL